jgi:hypothetical protein
MYTYCACVCTYVRIYACTYACMCMYVSIWWYKCIHAIDPMVMNACGWWWTACYESRRWCMSALHVHIRSNNIWMRAYRNATYVCLDLTMWNAMHASICRYECMQATEDTWIVMATRECYVWMQSIRSYECMHVLNSMWFVMVAYELCMCRLDDKECMHAISGIWTTRMHKMMHVHIDLMDKECMHVMTSIWIVCND